MAKVKRTKKNKAAVSRFATLSVYSCGEHRVDGHPIADEENACIAESYAHFGSMLQALAGDGVPAGSKLLVTIEVVKEAKPEPELKTQKGSA